MMVASRRCVRTALHCAELPWRAGQPVIIATSAHDVCHGLTSSPFYHINAPFEPLVLTKYVRNVEGIQGPTEPRDR
jgi:hypothetical protein